ncbi:hypothetical protein NHF46_01495 [Arthrobacter alpinus]|nr:hypothetical protein [Arthrobacter alpinus]
MNAGDGLGWYLAEASMLNVASFPIGSPTMREFEYEDLNTLGGLGRHAKDPPNSVPVPSTCPATHLYSVPTSSEISDLTGLRASASDPCVSGA